MKSIILSTLLLTPLLLGGCVGAGVDVGGYYPGYYDGPYYYGGPYYYDGPDVGVYYSNNGHYNGYNGYNGHYHHYDGGYNHVASNAGVHGGTHFNGTRTASVSSFGHAAGGGHSSSAHVSASARR